MVDHARLNEVLVEFVTTVTGAYDIGPVLYDLTDAVVAVLDCAAAAHVVNLSLPSDDDRLARQLRTVSVRRGPLGGSTG